MNSTAPNIYMGIPGWVILGLLGTLCVFAFWLKTGEYVWTLEGARPEYRRDQFGRRLRLVLTNVLGQKRRLDEPVTGTAHLLIVWAALLHVLAFFWNVIRATALEVFASIGPWDRVPFAEEVMPIRWLLASFAALGIAGVIVAVAARYGAARHSRSHAGIMSLLVIVFAASLAGATAAARSDTAILSWWVQMITTGILIAWLPFSREQHVLFAPVTTFSASLAPSKLPPPSKGVRYRDELTWRELIGGIACADCRRCERACPVFDSTHAGSPRDVMQALFASTCSTKNGRSMPADGLHRGQLWACSTCALCMEVCPSFNEHVPVMVDFRRRFVAEGNAPERVRMAMHDLMLFGNSLAAPPDQRGRWTAGLDFRVPDAREKPVAYLWFTGDYAAWDPAAVATRAAARVLHRAGIDFGILYEAEQNAGNDIRRAGAEDVFRSLAERNRRAIAEADFDRIITTDPHSYNALKNEYEWSGRRPPILHLSELLQQVFRTGVLPLRHELRGTVTYQDPCYLGRYNGVYDAPRRVIQELGLDIAEMPRNRAHAACCGAGGGRIWTTGFAEGAHSPAENRVREAASVRGVRTIVTSCPKDLLMLRYALRTTGLDDRLEVTDLAELVDEATRPVHLKDTRPVHPQSVGV